MNQADASFLEDYDPTAFERPSVTVDVVLLTVYEECLHALVYRRSQAPQKDTWALPGCFIGMRESLEEAAQRALKLKAGIEHLFLEQLYTFGRPDRDPRMRILSVAYYALLEPNRLKTLVRGDHIQLCPLQVSWKGEEGGPAELLDARSCKLKLAFDHGEILGMVVKRLRGKLSYAPIAYPLLPESFTLLQLQKVHEAILGRQLNKDSFRRKIFASSEIEPTGEQQSDVDHRPAMLYRRRSARVG